MGFWGNMECSICKKTSEIFCCDGCKTPTCKACGSLTSSEVKVLQLKERILKFHCKKCRTYETFSLLQQIINTKDELIESKENIILMLKEEMQKLNDKLTTQTSLATERSYTNVLQKNISPRPAPPVNVPSLIIKPRRDQDSEHTKKDLISNINPTELNIGVKKLRQTASGAITVNCCTREDVQKLKIEVEKKLKDKYKIEETKLRNPRIKIVGFQGDMAEKDIEISIRKQNATLFIDGDTLKVTFIRKYKDGSQNIFLECSSGLFNRIMLERKLYIDWERFHVYEDLSIKQCFKCCRLYHKSEECENDVVCSCCGESHERKVCPRKSVRCLNCIEANNKYKTKYDINHEADAHRICPTYQYHLNILKSKINYEI